MKFEEFTARIQNITKTSKAELTVAFLIIFGLIIGLAVEMFQSQNEQIISNNNAELYYLLDSIAEAEATTYIGTDMSNQVDSLLVQSDTIVEKKSLFPQHSSKPELVKDEKINLNTASKVELMKLPGVGEKTAQKIIEYRKNTSFNTIQEIQNIRGIGVKKFEKMKNNITVK